MVPAAAPSKPGNRPFHGPVVAAQPCGGTRSPCRHAVEKASLAKPSAQMVVVVALVGMEPQRSPTQPGRDGRRRGRCPSPLSPMSSNVGPLCGACGMSGELMAKGRRSKSRGPPDADAQGSAGRGRWLGGLPATWPGVGARCRRPVAGGRRRAVPMKQVGTTSRGNFPTVQRGHALSELLDTAG